jgi:glycerol-3-phosphate dehydrogenase
MNRFIENYANEAFDILVIGGGITGACVAYDAASRGLNVALVEKSDFGGATSAATSKVIHGGLRHPGEGGKYTTSRNLAQNVLKTAEKRLGKLQPCVTHKRRLIGSEIEDMEQFIGDIKRDNPDFRKTTVEYLGRNYGTEYDRVLKLARQDQTLAEVLNDDGEILAQAVYAVREEMARTLADVVLRRTGICTLGHPGKEILNRVAAVVARELNWDEARMAREIGEVEAILKVPAS